MKAGYVDDKDKGTARSYFEDLRIIDPAVENPELYLDEGEISSKNPLKLQSYKLELVEVKNNKAFVNVLASGKVIDSAVLEPGARAEFKRDGDKYLVFLVDEIFAGESSSRVQISQLLSGRIVIEAPKIEPVEEAGLVFYFPLNEKEGFDVYDYSGKGYQGSIYGATWTEGIDKSALKFDGLDDYVEIPDTSDKFEKGDHTFSVWTKSTGVRNNTKYILCHYNWRFYWGSDSEIYYTIGRMNDEDNSYYTVTAEVPSTKSDWIHLAGVYKPSEDKIILYVNGEFAGEKDIGKARIREEFGGSSRNLLIGTSKYSTSTFYEGMVDEVRIYNKALSQQEIRELVAESLGFSGISSYHASLALEKGEAVYVGNGFGLKYLGKSGSGLALLEGKSQAKLYSLENVSSGDVLLLEKSNGVPVIKLRIEGFSETGLELADVWVAAEKADLPLLEVQDITFSKVRACEPSSLTVKIENSGSRTYKPEGGALLELFLGEELVERYEIATELKPGKTFEQEFELNVEKVGKCPIEAVVSTAYANKSLKKMVNIEPPINSPVSRMPLYVEETETGITIYLTLQGSEIKGESWKDKAHVSVGIKNPLGSKVFHEKLYDVSGTAATIKIPYDDFYEGDEQYLINVDFRGVKNSVIVEIAGKDGVYEPPNNKLLLILLAIPLLLSLIRKRKS